MTNLIPRDNFFQDLFDFRRDFDQIFERFLSWPSAREETTMTTAGFSPAIESFIDQDGKKFHCQVMLPGVDPKNVNLQVQGNTLTISGERAATRETKEADFLRREITYGSFQRTMLLSGWSGYRQAERGVSQWDTRNYRTHCRGGVTAQGGDQSASRPCRQARHGLVQTVLLKTASPNPASGMSCSLV